MTMMPDVLLVSVYYKSMIMSAFRYKLHAYILTRCHLHHAVIGLMYIMEGALVLHILSIVILITMYMFFLTSLFYHRKDT